MSATPVLDPAVITALRQLTIPGDPDVLAEVLTIFLREAPMRIERLRNGVVAGDIEEIQRAAHSLKGSAGNIGARAMFTVCKQLDETGDMDTARPLVDAVVVEFGKVEAEIRRLTEAESAPQTQQES